MSGRLIAIEGLDGSGKSTLARGLARQLDAELLTTPSASLREVRHRVDEALATSPRALQLFYASTVIEAGERAREVQAAGRDVVVDRYWLSTLVYARHRGDWFELAEVEREVPPADLTVFLDLDETVRRDRMLTRGVDPNDRSTLVEGAAAALRRDFAEALQRPVAGLGVVLDVTDLAPDRVLRIADAWIRYRTAPEGRPIGPRQLRLLA